MRMKKRLVGAPGPWVKKCEKWRGKKKKEKKVGSRLASVQYDRGAQNS
jgi:hypothetical protein